MGAKLFLVVTVMVTVAGFASSARNCGEVMEITDSGKYGPYKFYNGMVKFPAPKNTTGMWMLRMKLTQPFKYVHSTSHNIFAGYDFEHNIVTFNRHVPHGSKTNKGSPIRVPFIVGWEPEQTMPKVEEIMWEGQQICQGAPSTTQFQAGNAIMKRKSFKSSRMAME